MSASPGGPARRPRDRTAVRLGTLLAVSTLGACAALAALVAVGGAAAARPATMVQAVAGRSAPAAPAAPKTRRPRPGLQLSIAVTGGRARVMAGDRITYAVTVRNAGAVAAPRLTITQTLPPGLRVVSASGSGVSGAGLVTWHAPVPAGGAARFTVTEQVLRLPAGQSRLAAVACASRPGSARPLVCAADLSAVPATVGAVAAGPRAGATAGWAVYAAVALLVLVAAGAAAAILNRRRPARH
jgi:uncharacterized repeat protein (TIGR01451 family)